MIIKGLDSPMCAKLSQEGLQLTTVLNELFPTLGSQSTSDFLLALYLLGVKVISVFLSLEPISALKTICFSYLFIPKV